MRIAILNGYTEAERAGFEAYRDELSQALAEMAAATGKRLNRLPSWRRKTGHVSLAHLSGTDLRDGRRASAEP